MNTLKSSSRAFTAHSLAACCLTLASTAFADSDSSSVATDQAVQLGPVVVTAVPPSQPLTVVTDPKAPAQPVPPSDGGDILKTIPGFATIRAGGTNGDPVLRGMFGSRINVLTNGSQMLGACPFRMDAPTSYIAPETYDRLTVIKGPETVIWGPGNSAGTVMFDRQTPRFNSPGLRAQGGFLGGSWGRNDQEADLTAGAPDYYGRVTASRSHEDDYHDGNGQVVPSLWDKWNADGAVGWTPDDQTRLELSGGAGNGKARYAGRGMDGSKFLRNSVALHFNRHFASGVLDELDARVYYNNADHVMDNYTLRSPDPDSMMPMPMASNVGRRTVGGRVAGTLKWSDAYKLVTGVDVQHNGHHYRDADGVGVYQTLPWTNDASFINTGLFGELTWYAAPRSRVVTGLRNDWASTQDQRQTLSSMMGPAPNPTAGQTRDASLPSGFLRYEHDLARSPATVYAGLGHVERFPDYWELFSPDTGPSGSINAFSGLRPEKTTQLDIGAQYDNHRLHAWVSTYAGEVNDFILFNYTSGMMGSTSQDLNIDAQIAGGEAGLGWQLTPHWKTSSTLAYAWGDDRSEHRPLPQMPPLEARLALDYNDQHWAAGALWRVVDGQHRYALGQGNVVGQDLGPSSGFGILSLNGSYRFAQKLRLSAGIDNLLNQTYAEHLNLAGDAGFGYPVDSPTPITEPGRQFWAKLDASF